MNDRFKFRVPVFDEGKFLCFHFFNAIDGADHYREIGPYAHGKEEQCTGLKDKNGNLIYEGDIVKTENNSIYKCVFEINYGYGVNSPGFMLTNEFGHAQPFDDDIEVIGNIHENSELLEDK